IRFYQPANAICQIADELRHRKNRVIGFQRELPSREVTNHHKRLAEANIHSYGKSIVTLDMKQGWLATESGFAHRAFVDQFLIDQLLNQNSGNAACDFHPS